MEYVIKKISENDKDFPNCLRTIPSRPKEIYLRGDLDLARPAVAIVGSRIPSAYGKQAVHDIAAGLVRAGVSIVSGMAPGIDTLAHQTALEGGGQTIGVLGTGLDEKSFFPKPNLDLAKKIVDTGGCLLSEYPPGFNATRYSFPQRNRIIAGLSLAILVVEAKEKSGSLYTAEAGRKQHKAVFAVPGSIYSASSAGCNQLLKQYARPATEARDILDFLGIAPAITKAKPATDNPNEQKIIDALASGAMDIDEIILATGMAAPTVMSLIPIMEINGLIKKIELNTYSLCN